jgi:hypothetical protein
VRTRRPAVVAAPPDPEGAGAVGFGDAGLGVEAGELGGAADRLFRERFDTGRSSRIAGRGAP